MSNDWNRPQGSPHTPWPRPVVVQLPDPLWMRVVARLSTADWWALGTAAVVGVVGGVLVGVWFR